ncbi:MAG: CapA family protein [Micromonosporaceae bacterium]
MTRDRKLITALTTLAVLAAGAVVARVVFSDPPVAAVQRSVSLGSDGRLSIQFVGDTFTGGRGEPYIAKYGYDWPFKNITSMLDADFTIATAEAAITARKGVWNLGKKDAYKTPPPSAAAMASAGIDSVTLANNQVFGAGPGGLADTLRHTRAAGLSAFGAGSRLAAAEQPLLLRSEVGTVGIVGLGESVGFKASDTTPGIVVLNRKSIERGVGIARAAGADWVVAYVHWGENYAPISKGQRYWAGLLARAGYDLIIGSGPHAAQPIEVTGSVPVVYSLGNFVYSTRGQWENVAVGGVGLSVDLVLARDRKPELSARCLLTDNAVVRYQPRPCTAEQAQRYLPKLHAGTVGRQNRSTVHCDCFTRWYE